MQKIKKFEIISTIFIMILGTLLHFLFEWSHYNPFIGSFSAVNESTWEHLKILFFPMLITTGIGYFYSKNTTSNYLWSKTIGILIAMAFIVVFFYTSTGIIGKNSAILNISSFYIAVILGEYIAYKKINTYNKNNNYMASILLFLLSSSFILFTFYPPHIGLFQDPLTYKYGIIEE